MGMRRIAAAIAGMAVAMGIVGVAVAPSASAATVNITVDCSSDNDLHANVGDTVVITMTSACTYNLGVVYNTDGDGNGYFGPLSDVVNSPRSDDNYNRTNDWYVYSDGSGTTRMTTTLADTNLEGGTLAVGATVARTGIDSAPFLIVYRGPGAAAAADKPIPMWVQAYARPSADAACPDGWAASWDQWPNGGKGGFVCQRSIKAIGN